MTRLHSHAERETSALPRQADAHDAPPLGRALHDAIAGDVRFDRLARTLYATDASLYEMVPAGVVMPKHIDDVVAAVNLCRAHGTPLVARGAGTGLTGGAVGAGVQLDLSRYMNRIGRVDVDGARVDVEPGVVLDDLNAVLSGHGFHFAPDVATSSRATLGGMIANNSCGAHSVLYGRTVDHVAGMTVVLSDGNVVAFGEEGESTSRSDPAPDGDQARQIETGLCRIRDDYFDDIQARFPNVLRSNGGYGLDRLGPRGTTAGAIPILCGSEGTLGIVVGATLKLTPLPRATGLVVFHFDELLDALRVTPAVLAHEPSAIELIDRMIIDAGRTDALTDASRSFLRGEPSALLIVEFFGDSGDEVHERVAALLADDSAIARTTEAVKIIEPAAQQDVWNLRRRGLGLLMSRPGQRQSHAFVEDSAVQPARLADYIERFFAMLRDENVEAGCYAHASVGCLHVRPVLNLRDVGDVERMRRIAERASDLALEFGGAMTGEHGDGLVRSCWIEKMYGPRIVQAFGEVKQLFDPAGLLNPHKIVDPLPMTENLRYGASYVAHAPKTLLDFSAHGGPEGLAGMCSGVGQCRQRLTGTMCPSFMATGDEVHTTRARANALRVALSNRGLLDGLDDPALDEVMDLCLSCKACKTECPTGVDMARLKSEFLFRRNLRSGVSRSARFIADTPQLARLASRFPRITNVIGRSGIVRAMTERRYGLDRRMPPPLFAVQTFRRWFDHDRKRRADKLAPRGKVVLFVDTWTDLFTPQVGVAAVKLLRRAGFDVLCPAVKCCGRPAISKGLLTEARQLAEDNVRILSRYAREGIPIVGVEPSCLLTLVDELPQLSRTRGAQRISRHAQTLECFLDDLLVREPDALHFAPPVNLSGKTRPLIYHAHCHQKAMLGTRGAMDLIHRVWGTSGSEINSGCCGMAGSFGHEKEHYDVARLIGEERLFPAVRARGDAVVAVSGFSCRHQIAHHTGVEPKHLIEHLADLLDDDSGG